MNVCIFVGNVGKDPTIKKAGESQVARFSIAIATREKEPVLWLNCEAWDGANYQLASLIGSHVKKGMKITVFGELAESSWTDPETKQARKAIFLRARNVQWVPSGQPANQQNTDDAGEPRW